MKTLRHTNPYLNKMSDEDIFLVMEESAYESCVMEGAADLTRLRNYSDVADEIAAIKKSAKGSKTPA